MRVRSLVVVAVIVAVAACSDSPVQPTQITPVNPRFSQIQGTGLAPYEIAPLSLYRPIAAGGNPADAGPRTKPGNPSDITYWGGGVIYNQKIVAIYYSPSQIFTNGPLPGSASAGAADQSLVGSFLNNLGGSSYWNINSTYYDIV